MLIASVGVTFGGRAEWELHEQGCGKCVSQLLFRQSSRTKSEGRGWIFFLKSLLVKYNLDSQTCSSVHYF